MIWPIAYAEKDRVEPLEDHLLRTAFIAIKIFEDELEYLSKEYPSVKKMAVLSALFHDLGKANRRSYEMYLKQNGKVSFRCHEVLSFLILEEISRSNTYKKLNLSRDEWNVIEYAVLNHHHAMRMVRECLGGDKRNYYEAIGLGRLKLWEVLGIEPPEDKSYWNFEGLSAVDTVKGFMFNEIPRMKGEYLKLSFVMSGFISLADSLAAFLYRGELRDTPQTPSKYIEVSLKERGYSVNGFMAEFGWLNDPSNIEELHSFIRKLFQLN